MFSAVVIPDGQPSGPVTRVRCNLLDADEDIGHASTRVAGASTAVAFRPLSGQALCARCKCDLDSRHCRHVGCLRVPPFVPKT